MNSNSADTRKLALLQRRLVNKMVDGLDKSIQRIEPAYGDILEQRRRAIRDYVKAAANLAVQQDRRFRRRREGRL